MKQETHPMVIALKMPVHAALKSYGETTGRSTKKMAEVAIEHYLIRKSVLKRKS